MEIRVDLKTPGHYLSTRSTWSVIKEIARELEGAIVDATTTIYPKSNAKSVRKVARERIDFRFQEIRKGSWEIVLLASLGGLLGKIVYDVCSEILKDNPDFKRFKDVVNSSLSRKAAEKFKFRMQRKQTLGPYRQREQSVHLDQKHTGVITITYQVKLVIREEKLGNVKQPISSEEQLADLFERMGGADRTDGTDR